MKELMSHSRHERISVLERTGSIVSRSDDDAMMSFVHMDHRSPSDISSINFTDAMRLSNKLHPSSRTGVTNLNLFATQNVGLLVNYAAVGIVHGLVQTIAYTFFNVFLNMEDYRAYAAEKWMALPWMLKFFMAVCSDCLPIRNYRRKPYMYIGWGISMLFAFVVLCLPREEAYMHKGVVQNSTAADAGSKYAALLMCITIGYVLADAAADGLMVEWAQLEELQSLENEGNQASPVIMMVYTVRYLAQFASAFLVAFLCNSDDYGGSFAWGASINSMMILVLVAGMGAIVATKFFLVEDQIQSPPSLLVYGKTLWQTVQQRMVWQTMIYVFISRVCFTYYATSAKAIYEYWVVGSVLSNNLFNAINYGVYAGVAMLLQRWQVLHISWRRIVLFATLASVLVTLISALFTVFNVVRSSFLTLLFEQFAAVCEALVHYVTLFAAVEAAEPGYECSSFAAVITMGNVAIAFAISLSQSIGAHFDVYNFEYEEDTTSVRAKVIYCFLIMCVVRLLNIAALPLLPIQRKHARDLKQLGSGSNKKSAIAVLVVASFLILWSIFVTILASFERTSCLTVAGGEGC